MMQSASLCITFHTDMTSDTPTQTPSGYTVRPNADERQEIETFARKQRRSLAQLTLEAVLKHIRTERRKARKSHSR